MKMLPRKALKRPLGDTEVINEKRPSGYINHNPVTSYDANDLIRLRALRLRRTRQLAGVRVCILTIFSRFLLPYAGGLNFSSGADEEASGFYRYLRDKGERVMSKLRHVHWCKHH